MYTFGIKEYRAIKSAKIRIDGITVLAGVNGSGKSTLSRWLYYLVNATHDFEHYQRSYFIQTLEQEVEKLIRLFRTLPKSNNYLSIRTQLRRFKDEDNLDWDILKQIYYSFIKKAEEDLRTYAESNLFKGRLTYYLLGNDTPEEASNQNIITTYIQDCYETYLEGFNNYLKKVESCSREELERVITTEFSSGELIPDEVTLEEGETSLLEKELFTPPLMLNRAIYINSPLAVSGNDYFLFRNSWQELQYYLYNENPHKKSISTNRLNLEIQSIICGDIQLTDDQLEMRRELHYVSKEQGIDINVSEAATGIKTFAYMSQLLRNGWLDRETLLMIDEPEAHLHPQWIVEFARLLVKINKELQVKILIASHNPDMVAAIQSIAQKEEVINNTVFYIAQKDKDDVRYNFVDIGTDISDIFTSFNLAISRIEMYGTSLF
jgi:ABC-type cobalamin/Fe3+-siderophores transport system ATPase subunit